MESYVTEEQQVEALKKWWQNHGKKVIGAAIIAATAFAGYNYYEHHTQVQRQEASNAYNTLLQGLNEQDTATIESRAKLLKENYPKTAYADLASFVLAKMAVKDNDLEKAINELTWVVDHSKIPELKSVAKVRLARVTAQVGKPNDALSIIDKGLKDSAGYKAILEELKGDLLMDENKVEDAKKAYESALEDINAQKLPLLKLKFEDLGGELDKSTLASSETDAKDANASEKVNVSSEEGTKND